MQKEDEEEKKLDDICEKKEYEINDMCKLNEEEEEKEEDDICEKNDVVEEDDI